jgi:hypothetical protein
MGGLAVAYATTRGSHCSEGHLRQCAGGASDAVLPEPPHFFGLHVCKTLVHLQPDRRNRTP